MQGCVSTKKMTEFKTVTNIYTGETTDSNIVNAKEIEIIKREVTKDDIVLDIGANVGFMTTVLAEQAQFVYAFEPAPDNFKQLQENTKHLVNVELFEFAVCEETGGNRILYTCPQDPGMNRLYDSKWCKDGKQIQVITTTIDYFAEFFLGTQKLSFVKIDIEGYEYYAIIGMEDTISRDHPTLLMEWHPPSMEEAKIKPEDFHYLLNHGLGYDNPINCNTGETIPSYEELDRQTRDQPAVNILWKYHIK